MGDDEPILTGHSCLAASIPVTVFATLFFFALAAILLSGDDPWTPIHGTLSISCIAVGILTWPWQILDVKARRHVLTERGIIYRSGVLSRFEVEIPYSSVLAVSVRQGPLQRLFRCGDVRISAQGVTNRPVLAVSSQDANSICLKSIPDFAEVSAIVKERLPR